MKYFKNYTRFHFHLLGILGFITIILVSKIGFERNNEQGKLDCICGDWFKRTEFNEKVTGRFEDSDNHMVPTLVINNDESNKVFLHKETSGFYYHVDLGDSIEKAANSLIVKIFRDSVEIWQLSCCPLVDSHL